MRKEKIDEAVREIAAAEKEIALGKSVKSNEAKIESYMNSLTTREVLAVIIKLEDILKQYNKGYSPFIKYKIIIIIFKEIILLWL